MRVLIDLLFCGFWAVKDTNFSFAIASFMFVCVPSLVTFLLILFLGGGTMACRVSEAHGHQFLWL